MSYSVFASRRLKITAAPSGAHELTAAVVPTSSANQFCSGPALLAGFIRSSQRPCVSDENAMFLPSGDQTGDELSSAGSMLPAR